MSAISSAAAAIAKHKSTSATASNATKNSAPDAAVVKASFSDVLSQVQAVVTGKPRTGFNSGVTNSLTAQTSAIKSQTRSAIQSTLSTAKSLLSIGPKTGVHP